MATMGKLFERLAAVAKENPLATRRKGYSAEQLSTISDDNRWICFPYPRQMNANAIIVNSSGTFSVIGNASATTLNLGALNGTGNTLFADQGVHRQQLRLRRFL